jgi:hypothetical protein
METSPAAETVWVLTVHGKSPVDGEFEDRLDWDEHPTHAEYTSSTTIVQLTEFLSVPRELGGFNVTSGTWSPSRQ